MPALDVASAPPDMFAQHALVSATRRPRDRIEAIEQAVSGCLEGCMARHRLQGGQDRWECHLSVAEAKSRHRIRARVQDVPCAE